MKYNIKKAQMLAELLGHTSCTRTTEACSGKWAGTYDHSLVFEDGTSLFICNGSENFNKTIEYYIECMENLSENNKKIMIGLLQEQAKKDAIKASAEGLLPCHPISINIKADVFFDITVLMKVEEKEFFFNTSNLSYALRGGPEKLKEYLDRKNSDELFTAGAVKEPTFIFTNVRFSHKDDLYKKIK